MYLWLLLGFVFLVKGADLFVDGCSSIAKTLRVPSIIIGLTIVAFGTSAPEASVSIMASLSGNNDIAISNVIGSNLFNSLAVIGVCGVVLPMKIQGGLLKKEMPFSILVTGLLLLFCMFSIGGGKGVLQIGRLEGLILLLLFAGFLYMQIRSALKTRTVRPEEENIGRKLSPVRSIVYAMGNVIGSNIFNILLIIGASAAISPMTISRESIYDGAMLLVMSIILFVLAKKGEKISRGEAVLLLALYGGYTAYIIIR